MVAAATMRIRAAFPDCQRSSVEVGHPFKSRGGCGVTSSHHRRHFYPAERSDFISPQSGPGSQIFFHVSLFPLDAERLKIT